LNFTQIGLITFVYQLTASLLQPFIGFILIKPKPIHWQLVFGTWIALLSVSTHFWMILVAVSLVGIGSSYFIQKRRVLLFLGSGGRGLAQSIFQLVAILEVQSDHC
jgi:FSR family fosmidomycin resistance protein-like MFS transporter